jgi:hypothetical protein
MTLTRAWNRDFSPQGERRNNLVRFMRQRLAVNPKGKGNRAWKRLDVPTLP